MSTSPFSRILYFNSQPHEEADRLHGCKRLKLAYFNSQPHEEADDELEKRMDEKYISTHSLTKRLTDKEGTK